MSSWQLGAAGGRVDAFASQQILHLINDLPIVVNGSPAVHQNERHGIGVATSNDLGTELFECWELAASKLVMEDSLDLQALFWVVDFGGVLQFPSLELIAPENVDDESSMLNDTSLPVFDIAGLVVVSFDIFKIFNMRDVSDLLAIGWISVGLQRRLLGNLQMDAEFVAGLLEDVLGRRL